MSGLRRRRAQSSSRAEEIVTAELRARRAQPDRPVHRAADSLLSWASAAPLHTRGLVNWAGLLLALSGARLVLENLLTYGLRVSAAGWATFLLGAAGQPHHYPVLYLLAALHLPLLATLHLERLLSAGRLAASTATGLHCATLVLVFALPVLLINLPALKFGLVSAVLACGGYCVIGLKLVSYIQVNSWCRSPRAGRLAREKSYVTPAELRRGGEAREGEEEAREKGGLVTYPDNLSLRDLYYFMLAPTLCYELNFPRTTRIRKTFLLRRLLEVVLLTQLVLALTQQWIIPDLLNSLVPFSRTDLPVATERLIRLSLPNHIIWLLGGYLVFHSCLNISGEVRGAALCRQAVLQGLVELPQLLQILAGLESPRTSLVPAPPLQAPGGSWLVQDLRRLPRLPRLLAPPRVHGLRAPQDAQTLALPRVHVQRSSGAAVLVAGGAPGGEGRQPQHVALPRDGPAPAGHDLLP